MGLSEAWFKFAGQLPLFKLLFTALSMTFQPIAARVLHDKGSLAASPQRGKNSGFQLSQRVFASLRCTVRVATPVSFAQTVRWCVYCAVLEVID